MPIHKSIKEKDVFFKSHYMTPSSHFESYLAQSEMRMDFTQEQLDQLKQMPFIEVNDYMCISRRARTTGSFFPSLDRPIIEAAGFRISNKQHVPFYRPRGLSTWNPMEKIARDYKETKEKMGKNMHIPYLRNSVKVPHAIGIKVNNRNLFFETLKQARDEYSRQTLRHLLQYCSTSALSAFLDRFEPLTKIAVFHDLFSQVYAFTQYEGSINNMQRYLYTTYVGSHNLPNLHAVSRINGKLEQLASLDRITLDDYTAFLEDGLFGRIASSMNDDTIRFYQINVDVDAREVTSSYKDTNSWSQDDVRLFYMIYFRYHHALFIKEHSLFDTFVSLYTQAVGQRLKDEVQTNTPLFSALSKQLTNEQIWQHHHLQNTMPDDYVHPLFNPSLTKEKVEDYNRDYVRNTNPLLVMFAKTYFPAGSESTPLDALRDRHMAFTLNAYPGYNYDSLSFRLSSAMKGSIFFTNGLYERLDGVLQQLHPPKTFDAHVPFEIFRHKFPESNFFSTPLELATKFELT